MSLPAGYTRVTSEGVDAFVREEAAGWLEEGLTRHPTLYDWAGARQEVERIAGRAPVRVVGAPVRGPADRERWAFRRYARGGAVRALGDRHLAVGTPRPLRELRASVEARARGVPTPAVVAGASYRAGLFYRADLVTEMVPHARSLAAIIADDDQDRTLTALRLAGGLIRTLAAAGVLHPDLNAHNVLLVGMGGAMEAWVVDLDRGRLQDPGAPGADPMRRRLERSLRKVSAANRRALGARAWAALRSGLEERP